jgi:uroporphyrinogen decarboxylase
MEQTSYQRVFAALEHKEPDRIPIDLGGTAVTGINIQALRKLKDHMGIPGEVLLRDQITQLAVTDDATFGRLDLDVRTVRPQPPANMGPARDQGLVGSHYRLTDEWGMGWQMPVAGGHYYDLYHSSLANAETVREVENFPWPDALDAARYVGMRDAADRVVHGEQKAFILERMSSGIVPRRFHSLGRASTAVDVF